MAEFPDQLRRLIAAAVEGASGPKRSILQLPGVHDPLTARLAHQAGFQALYLSGPALAAALLGVPDPSRLSLTEVTQGAQVVVHAARLPLVVDLDGGFGGPAAVRRAVETLQGLGVAGVVIHDGDGAGPVQAGARRGLLAAKDSVRKLEAALDAADRRMVVMARTVAGDLTQAAARAQLYDVVGAAALWVDALATLERVADVRPTVSAPLVVDVSLVQPPPRAVDMARFGVTIVAYSQSLLVSLTAALAAGFRHLRRTGALPPFITTAPAQPAPRPTPLPKAG